jgi:hypothetical protein
MKLDIGNLVGHIKRDIVIVLVGDASEEVLLIDVCNSNCDRDRLGPLGSGNGLKLIMKYPDTWVTVGISTPDTWTGM